MRRGVFPYALAPSPATAPVFKRVALQGCRPARRVLLVAMLAALLLISAPTGVFSANQTHDAQARSTAAWSCRGVYHVVRRGETIYSIARRYGTTAYRIAVCNGLASYTVYVGQTLLVPVAR